MWQRVLIKCLHKLIENPTFKDKIAYTPECVYADAEGKSCLFDEM